jgi:hypothetical protein
VRWAIAAAVAFVAAYALTVALYASTGLAHAQRITQGRPAADGTRVTIDVDELHPLTGALSANLTVAPAPALLDPVTHNLKDDLNIAVTSEVTTMHSWPKGTVPGVLPVPLAIPLRNSLPDAPPIGFWIDVTVVLWVIVALVASMTLYIYCWWRQVREPQPTPT